MADIAYFYKDSVTGVYMINGNAVSKGNYILNSYSNDTVIEIVSKTNNKSILGPIEISNLKKENTDTYSNLAEILTDNTTFFSKETIVPPIVSNIKYGRLYNWYAVSNANFAPEGWHVPTQAELEILLNEIDTIDTSDEYNEIWPLAGGLLKEIGDIFWTSNVDATNIYAFNARGSGAREESDGSFTSIKDLFELVVSDNLYQYYIDASSAQVDFYDYTGGETRGSSVRLIKDDSINPGSLTDLDGNVYRTCKIGNQVWLADNWACTKLNDGTAIPNITDDTEWSSDTIGAYCNYNNDIGNVFL